MQLEVALNAEHDAGRVGWAGEHSARDEIENPLGKAGGQERLEPQASLARLVAQRLRLGDVALPVLGISRVGWDVGGMRAFVGVAHRSPPRRPLKRAENGAAPLLGAQALAVEALERRAHLVGQRDAFDRADAGEASPPENEARLGPRGTGAGAGAIGAWRQGCHGGPPAARDNI